MPYALPCIGSLVEISNEFHHISGVTSKKPPWSSLKLYFLLVWKHLKFQNWRTTNQTSIKLGPDMYHLSTFNIPKHEGDNKWASGGRGVCNQKTTSKCHEIKRISTFTSSKTNSGNAKEKGIFSLSFITI